ncbi:MAG: DUF2325 domain-containing protein [Clostridiales bacterium]|nr:DUF2325 domain-containing protein [Clostridiales bacterium]MDD7346943.1 DUF2325 domain-containing protein [Clostridiales bacterium]MDY4061206.1 DUF2325 domain-containing protein [Anaerovoracaceae bacterium]
MSIVIIGGNDCMVCKYKNLCKDYNCEAKVFTQMKGTMKSRIGNPDLLVLFTNTVSHKMIRVATNEAKASNLPIERCHSSSLSALRGILDKHVNV